MERIRIRVKDFGPISSADIELKPLTILIGKNNAGKSTLAKLIYSVIRETLKIFEPPYVFALHKVLREKIFELLWKGLGERERIKEIAENLVELRNLAGSIIAEEVAKAIEDSIYTLLNRGFEEERGAGDILERYFSAKAGNLINIHSDRAEAEFDLPGLGLKVIIERGYGVDVRPKIHAKIDAQRVLQALEGGIVLSMNTKTKSSDRYLSILNDISSILAMSIVSLLSEELYDELGNVYYMPDGRAGLIEGYEAISSAFISMAPIAPLKDISMPSMHGIAVEFYKTLLSLRGEKGYYAEIVDEKFAEILGGRIVYEREPPLGRPRLIYSFSFKGAEASISLLNAASMVKELAPIYMTLRELVKKGDLLIIEEPEAHLHPSAQVKLAEILAVLVNRGLNVLITTHSDIFLSKIANIVYRGASEAGGGVSLREDQVAVYLLRENDHGYIVEKVDILEKMPTFDEVIDRLYEEEKEIYIARLSKRSS